MKEVSATGETCLHTAVGYNKGKVIQYLTKWLGERTGDNEYLDLINRKDRSGNTVLHLATSRKQLQVINFFFYLSALFFCLRVGMNFMLVP